MWNNQSRVERVEKKSAFKTEIPKPNGNPLPQKPASNGKIPFDDLDDEINLEIEEVGGFY